jgi:hypothetical protein
MRALVGAFCDLARDLCADDGGPAPDDVGEGPEGEAGPIDDAGEALAPVDDDAPLAPADDPNLARNSQWWQHESGAWRMGPSRRRSGYSVMVPLDSVDGFKGRASRLAENCGGRWHYKSGGYLLSLRGGNRFIAAWNKSEARAAADDMPIVADETPPPINPAPDLVATVAELLARVAALESARPAVTPHESPPPVAVDPVADATVEYWRARAVDAEARGDLDKRALMAANEANEKLRRSNADLEQRAAALPVYATEPGAVRADLATMTAERDALAEWSRATRQRTAGRLRAVRDTARELETMNCNMAGLLANARTDAGEAWKARLDEQAKVEALTRELARYRMSGALPAMRYVAGHIGTMRPAEPIEPQVGARRAA